MVTPLVVAKFFAPELFGSYSLAKMIAFFFATLLIDSSQTPFVVFANRERQETGKINKAFSVQCVFLALGFCVFAVFTLSLSKYITAFAKISYVDLVFVSLGFVGIALKTFLCNLFMALGQRIKNSLAELVFGFSSLVLIFLFYFIGQVNLRMVFLIYPLSAIVLAVVFFRTVDFKQLFPFYLERQYFNKTFNFTKWVFLGVTAVYFINWGDNLVLRYFVSMEDIGVYNLGYQFFKGTMILFATLGAYFLPFISQHINDPKKIREYLYHKRPMILFAGAIVIAIGFLLTPKILGMIYGETYIESAAVLRVLLIGTLIYLYNVFYNPIMNALEKYKFIHLTNVVQVLLNVILNIVLIPIYGMIGAAVATVIAYACKAIMFEIYFRLKIKKLFAV
ncbi:MAG: polysaccharide biosynthesis C-terminal domain-containing protein [Planctomycetes bacterium]|nr:polysaccharide biosynthesis C-terminal domain-containing protein [Planctomycetota bacterium]